MSGADAVRRKEEGATALKAEWGESKFASKIAGVIKAVDNYGGQEVRDLLTEHKIDNHPAIVKMFDKIYDGKLGEDTIVQGAGPANTTPSGGIVYDKSPEMRGK